MAALCYRWRDEAVFRYPTLFALFVKQLKEKDDANMKLMGERIKSNQINKLGREEKDMLVEQVRRIVNPDYFQR